MFWTLEVKLKSLPLAPAIVGFSSDDAMQILVVVESCDMATALLDIMTVYFVFNTDLPKSLYTLLIFIQHYIFNIKDEQHEPNAIAVRLTGLEQVYHVHAFY